MPRLTAVRHSCAGGSGMDTRGLFNFEIPDFGNLDLMPVSIRHRLDRCGLKLSLAAWQSFSLKERESLLRSESMPGGTAWKTQLLSNVKRRGAEVPPSITPWIDPPQIPGFVRAACAEYVGTMNEEAWQELSELKRYVLCKLSNSKWRDRLLPEALKEFGFPGT